MALTAASIDRLKAQLLTSGLSQKDQPLFQVINTLIDAVRTSLFGVETLNSNNSGGGSGSSTIINNTILNGLGFGLLDGEDGLEGIPGIQGPRGLVGPSGGQIFLPSSLEEITEQILPPGVGIQDPGFYSVGSWTPLLTGTTSTSGQTYTEQTGRYVKIGKMVFAKYRIILSNKGALAGIMQIEGLPFISDASLFSFATIRFNNMATNWIALNAICLQGNNRALLNGINAAGTTNTTTIAPADISNTTDLIGDIFYLAANG